MKKNMHLGNQKLDVVISQRLKLATQDMKYADWDEVLNRVICLDRDMTPDKIAEETLRIEVLCEGARQSVERMKDNYLAFFLGRIMKMDLTKAELAVWTADVAQCVLSFEGSQTIDPAGFIPHTVRLELQQVMAARQENSECTVSKERLAELLAYCLLIQSLRQLHEPNAAEKQNTQEAHQKETAEDTLGAKAVAAMRDAGKLHAGFAEYSDEELRQLRELARQDDALHMSSQQAIKRLTQELVRSYAADRANDNTPVFECSKADLEARHQLALAVMRNLKAVGKLPENMMEMSDEDLAVVVYASTELGYYFDDAAAGRMSVDGFWEIAENLMGAAMFTLLTLSTFSVNWVLGLFMALIAGVCAITAVERFLTEMFPAGVDETRLGRCVKATAKQIRTFAAQLSKPTAARQKAAQEPMQEPEVEIVFVDSDDVREDDEVQTDDEETVFTI